MRALVVAVLLGAATPAAGDSYGVMIEGQLIDIRGGQAVGYGPAVTTALGHGRLQLIAEAGAGMLGSTKPSDKLGIYASARAGGRVVAASLASAASIGFDVQLVLDAGIGAERYWLDGGSTVDRPYAFFGWGTHLAGRHHALAFDLRITAAPKLDDATALRVLCRGTCPGPDDAPADFAIEFVFGVTTW
jgi:hypothetical protein